MDLPTLTHSNAKNLMLAAMGLEKPRQTSATKADVLATIREMGVLQIDTIHVVARSPYLVLWSRLGDYDPEWLDELLAEGALFEYWSHAMAFIPVEDFPLFRRKMLDAPQSNHWIKDWIDENSEVIDQVRRYLQEHGIARSSSFENGNKSAGGWWNWKEEKKALDYLHYMGELVIARREKFQRVYTPLENRFPGWDDARVPSAQEAAQALTLKAVRALGITQAAWVPDYYRQPKVGIEKRLEALVEAGALLRLEVEGWGTPGYAHPDRLPLLQRAAAGEIHPQVTTLLSPFDPLIWDRKRLKALFDFDYTIECYLPQAKRRYGYFTLPVLHGNRLVGRLDPKAHRKEGLFEVKALHLEPGVALDEGLLEALTGALRRVAAWHKTPEVVVRMSDPPDAAERLNSRL